MTPIPTNRFKQRLRAQEPQLGCWLSTGSATVAELVGYSGFDWCLIDGEHGPNTLTSIQEQLRALDAAGGTGIVRPAATDEVLIKQVLDAGAQTLLLPMVSSAAEATAAVAAMHYPTAGTRGVGFGIARSSRWGRFGSYAAEVDEQLCCIIQIESREAVDQLDDILAVPGIDAAFVGPVDLGWSLGNPPADELDALVCELLGRIRAAGLGAGSLAFAPATARRYLDAGATFVAAAADADLLTRALDRTLAEVRAPVR